MGFENIKNMFGLSWPLKVEAQIRTPQVYEVKQLKVLIYNVFSRME